VQVIGLAEHPTIQNLAGTPSEILQFFTPVERAVIEVCKELVGVKNE